MAFAKPGFRRRKLLATVNQAEKTKNENENEKHKRKAHITIEIKVRKSHGFWSIFNATFSLMSELHLWL